MQSKCTDKEIVEYRQYMFEPGERGSTWEKGGIAEGDVTKECYGLNCVLQISQVEALTSHVTC